MGSHLGPKLGLRHEVMTIGRLALPSSPRHVQGDLEDQSLLDTLSGVAPDAVIHLAALTDADLCEEQPERARIANADVPARLASAVANSCGRFIHVSTDLVFDGERGPYAETDSALPVSVYGRTKLAGERAAASILGERVSIVRLSLVYGPRASPRSRPSFVERMLARASRGEKVSLFEDEFRTPVYVEDVASALALLAEHPSPPGIVHLGGPDRCSRLSMGVEALAAFNIPLDRFVARSRCSFGGAPRPRDVSLSSSVARALGFPSRSFAEGLSSMRREMERAGFMVGSEIAVPDETL